MGQRNLWKNDLIASAYFYQQKAVPYVELLKTTEAFIDTKAGEWWLDVGCGSGPLIQSIWRKSGGQIGKIIGVDLSYRSVKTAKASLDRLGTTLTADKVEFLQADISRGLGFLRPNSFHGITAGLCLSYAEHWDPIHKKWDRKAYIGLIGDLFAVLKNKGTLILSLNVPNPNFTKIALHSWKQILLTWKAPLHLMVSLVMLFHSRWLKRCATMGRFHYVPIEEVLDHLQHAGFTSVSYELTYAGQAWVFSACKSVK
jgi:ubiquinone/menaquinone biosynthesis C-methylase UbiE